MRSEISRDPVDVARPRCLSRGGAEARRRWSGRGYDSGLESFLVFWSLPGSLANPVQLVGSPCDADATRTRMDVSKHNKNELSAAACIPFRDVAVCRRSPVGKAAVFPSPTHPFSAPPRLRVIPPEPSTALMPAGFPVPRIAQLESSPGNEIRPDRVTLSVL